MVVTGAALLWVGWFGFNAGSSWAADGLAGMAMLVTHISAATAALTWLLAEFGITEREESQSLTNHVGERVGEIRVSF